MITTYVKRVWIFVAATALMGLIANIPYKKYQKAYLDEFHKIHYAPQRRIDATNKYIEDIENGLVDISNGILTTPPPKYYSDFDTKYVHKVTPIPLKKYQKPLYVRDKSNPKILHPVINK